MDNSFNRIDFKWTKWMTINKNYNEKSSDMEEEAREKGREGGASEGIGIVMAANK